MFQFVENENRLTAASNKVALILTGNTPFYPLYLYLILGRAGLPWILFSAASLPFFAATFWISRRNGLYGRSWLCAIATLNSIYVTWLLGEASATALFLLPVISLAVLSFSSGERLPMAIFTALPFLLFYFLHGHFPPPPEVYGTADYRSMAILNEFSVASITAVLAYIFSRAREDSPDRHFSLPETSAPDARPAKRRR
jgi:hypothetical protein